MKSLNTKAWLGLIFLVVAMGLLVLVSVGAMHYRQVWIFPSVFAILVSTIIIYLAKNGPALLECRVNVGPAAEKEKG